VRVADRKQRARHSDRVVHRRTFADPPIVDVASEVTGRNGVDHIGLFGSDTDYAEMRSDRNANVFEDPVVLFDGAVVDRNPRIVDGVMNHSERIGLRRPPEIIDRLRPVPLPCCIDLEDRDDLAGLGSVISSL